MLILYLTSYLALGRRPRFRLKDATVFATVFLFLFLTSYGISLYGGFSKIHNYLLICSISVGFGLIYFKDILGHKLPTKPWFIIIMLLFGYLFGLTSSVTAISFLICVPIYLIYLHFTKQKTSYKKLFLSWRGAGILGAIAAIFTIYVLGPGLADYDTSEIYRTVCDYLPFGEIFNNIWDSIRRIVFHNAYNFGRFLLPFIVVTIPLGIYIYYQYHKHNLKLPKFTQKERNFLAAVAIFIIFHILALSQIYYITRMVMPVHLVAVAAYLYVSIKLLTPIHHKKSPKIPLAIGIILIVSAIIVARLVLALSYRQKVIPILDQIKNSPDQVLCVTREDARSYNFPYLYLGQEDFLVDWAMPQTIYGKTIIFCES
ncbi:hypothetical protein IJ096_03420 [Candidatus Saccharibacteria bacterium]|nr:hypothetical protein [Candidatus Saccharibacteria bacterium]